MPPQVMPTFIAVFLSGRAFAAAANRSMSAGLLQLTVEEVRSPGVDRLLAIPPFEWTQWPGQEEWHRAMGLLEGKTALVTGGGTGIGRGIAQLLAAEGAKVVVAARREAPLKETCALAPDTISHVLMDLTKSEERAAALQAVIDRHGKLDILVSNAGYQLWKTFTETSDEEIDALFATNLSATTRFIKQALPYLEASRGNIVIISSTASRYTAVPSQKLSVYSASKAGLNQLVRTLAPELGPMGIRINAVAPGLTRGEYSDGSLTLDDATQEWIRQVTPLGRIGEPEDIARTVAFIASDQASWVTGQVIDASGGWQIAAG
jgi:NAD(P)-dependent dehydrogenase (short-subunit alcohol dehydrogenase family)